MLVLRRGAKVNPKSSLRYLKSKSAFEHAFGTLALNDESNACSNRSRSEATSTTYIDGKKSCGRYTASFRSG